MGIEFKDGIAKADEHATSLEALYIAIDPFVHSNQAFQRMRITGETLEEVVAVWGGRVANQTVQVVSEGEING